MNLITIKGVYTSVVFSLFGSCSCLPLLLFSWEEDRNILY